MDNFLASFKCSIDHKDCTFVSPLGKGGMINRGYNNLREKSRSDKEGDVFGISGDSFLSTSGQVFCPVDWGLRSTAASQLMARLHMLWLSAVGQIVLGHADSYPSGFDFQGFRRAPAVNMNIN